MTPSPSPHQPQFRIVATLPRQAVPADPALRYLAISGRFNELRRRRDEIAELQLKAAREARDARDDRNATLFALGLFGFLFLGTLAGWLIGIE